MRWVLVLLEFFSWWQGGIMAHDLGKKDFEAMRDVLVAHRMFLSCGFAAADIKLDDFHARQVMENLEALQRKVEKACEAD